MVEYKITKRRPNFLVIGAQKSGTTWFHHYLKRHKDVYIPRQKELMFFDVQRNYERWGIEQYLSCFMDADSQTAVGEVTPGYLWCSTEHPEWYCMEVFRAGTPERVKEHLGVDVKKIVLLRNPIDRAVSGFLHHMRKGRIPNTATLEDYLDKLGVVHMGFYGAHLARWNEVFPKSDFHVVTYEQFFESSRVRSEILDFIGVKPLNEEELLTKEYNKGYGHIRDETGVHGADGQVIAERAVIEKLRGVYQSDVNRLVEEWGLDVSVWANDFG